MSALQGFVSKVGLASATSADGVARSGATLDMSQVDPSSLGVSANVTIVTGSVVATFNPQVSWDGTNWFNVKLLNNAANVTVAATAAVYLSLGGLGAGARYFRCQVTLSGATTAAGDLTALTYRYVRYGNDR